MFHHLVSQRLQQVLCVGLVALRSVPVQFPVSEVDVGDEQRHAAAHGVLGDGVNLENTKQTSPLTARVRLV